MSWKLRCCIHGLTVNVLFVFRPYVSSEEKDTVYDGLLYLASSSTKIKDDKIWVEMIELFLNCAKFRADEVQYGSLTNDWNLHFWYLALNFLKAKVNSSLICSMLRTESGLRFTLWRSDLPLWPILVPDIKQMGELFGLAFSAVFENTEYMTL